MASLEKLKEVCGVYNLTTLGLPNNKYRIYIFTQDYRIIDAIDLRDITNEELEEIAVSWALKSSFGDNPPYVSKNPFSEIYLPGKYTFPFKP